MYYQYRWQSIIYSLTSLHFWPSERAHKLIEEVGAEAKRTFWKQKRVRRISKAVSAAKAAA